MHRRPATVTDIHRVASGMPYAKVCPGTDGNAVYQVSGKSFVFFRNPRPDAVDPETGERLDDVIVLWVASEEEKSALLSEGKPFFTTPHFDGHPSVLIRESDLSQLTVAEVTELVQDAWLARASRRRCQAWLAEQDLT